MRILISNDDGVFAEGIRTLAAAAAARGHKVTVVCPDQERSATGHGLTLQTPIRAERADELFVPGVTAWACSGTPADCMKLALFELVDEKPDLVLSGINHGPNLGTDVFCSGTVAAAMEGTLEAIPSMAVSSACFQWRQFQAAADLAVEIAEQALEDACPHRQRPACTAGGACCVFVSASLHLGSVATLRRRGCSCVRPRQRVGWGPNIWCVCMGSVLRTNAWVLPRSQRQLRSRAGYMYATPCKSDRYRRAGV